MKKKILVKTEHLKKYFPVKSGFFSRIKGYVKAVNDISLYIYEGETFGLVGESGCGKTTLGRTILQLIKPTAGTVYFEDTDLAGCSSDDLRKMRKNFQIIFQDPYSSLNPRMTVLDIVTEGLVEHKIISKNKRKEKAVMILEKVGLDTDYIYRYPHEFSGGQRQRVSIGRAISMDPQFIVCDEAVSALDVSIQAQIINLLIDLKNEMNLSYLFISHDLSVVKHISDRIAVMYMGSIVELAGKEELFSNPLHPYTKALLAAIPVPDPAVEKKKIELTGDPVISNTGCVFCPRCKYSLEKCRRDPGPELVEKIPGHFAACHFDRRKSNPRNPR